MNRRAGFTIVELIIVIVIIGILLTLAVVNLQGSQVGARDDERKTDTANIARALETYYTSGNDTITTPGQYPDTSFLSSGTDTAVTQVLRDIDTRNLRAPGAAVTGNITLVAANNAIQTTTGVLPQPLLTGLTQYVYQPIASDGISLCTSGMACRSFNLYYRLETDNTIYEITSKNQ